MFAMFAMIVDIFTSTLWAPPQGSAEAIVLGLLGHMMNSVILGAVFLALVHSVHLVDLYACGHGKPAPSPLPF